MAVARDGVLARVVAREGELDIAAKQAQEIGEVLRAGRNVPSRNAQLARPHAVTPPGVGHHLHKPDGTFPANRIGVVPGLGLDDRVEQRRIEREPVGRGVDLGMVGPSLEQRVAESGSEPVRPRFSEE